MKTYPKRHLSTAIFLAVCFLVILNALPAREADAVTQFPVSLSIEPPVQEPRFLPEVLHEAAQTDVWNTVQVKAGDSLSTIFKRAGLSPRELHEVISIGPDVAVLSKLMPGQSIQLKTSSEGKLISLYYEPGPLKQLQIGRRDDRYSAQWIYREPEVLLNYKTARITPDNPSLYHAGKQAGLSDNLIMKLSYIFQWDISFALDLRQGDSFTVLYEEIYIEGEKINEGDILAARFNNLGKTFTAVQFKDRAGRKDYYTPDGRSLRKAFIRDPVHFSHVSSSFNLRRLHPIHKKVMPHRGIDYAAGKGTPVIAAGDGKVTVARQNNASGRYVVIQHGEQYTTKYLHLSKYARGIRAGKNVQQGQTIGYVGATGWATAPHLHYEFLVNGVHRNPRTVKLPKAQPIASTNLSRFREITGGILARLDSVDGARRYARVDRLVSPSDGE